MYIYLSFEQYICLKEVLITIQMSTGSGRERTCITLFAFYKLMQIYKCMKKKNYVQGLKFLTDTV